jgi:molecular chaperone GrpE
MSFGDEAVPEEEAAFSEAEAAQEAAEAAAARSGRASHGNGHGSNADAAHGSALAEEADPRETLARERDEYLLALQRTQADFENYRKRIARQQQEQSARAALSLVDKLLPVLDTLDLAEAHLNESFDVGEDAKALRASRAMLMDILSREGLERVDQAGVPFDPSVHDAVARSEAEGGENGETVVEEVLRSGYRWKGQALRAAMVRVRG